MVKTFWDSRWHIHTSISSSQREVWSSELILNFYQGMQPVYPSMSSSLQATLKHKAGLIARLSAYATLGNAFQLPVLEPWKKTRLTYFWGKMLRSDAQRNKIYPMSFNLTVVLSQLLNRGRHMCSCRLHYCVQCVCACAVDAVSRWNSALKLYKATRNFPATFSQNNVCPAWRHHHLCETTTGFRFLYPLRVTHENWIWSLAARNLNQLRSTFSACGGRHNFWGWWDTHEALTSMPGNNKQMYSREDKGSREQKKNKIG